MYKLSGTERIIDIANIPLSNSGAPEPLLSASEGKLTLTYASNEEGNPRVTVNFNAPLIHIFGVPGDETIQSHPLFEKGLKPYAISEVLDSGWIEELKKANSVHSQHDPERFNNFRHFIFAFHDSTFECIAISCIS